MVKRVDVSSLLTSASRPVLDVRTPAEFAQGHIPGALNLPLFSNEERIAVGTTYKQQGREAAILLGFELTGPKWAGYIRTALEMAPSKKVMIHCWRGGMRSDAMAWALNLYGFDVEVIEGGYKAFRRQAYEQFARKMPLRVIGGMTGSGKTTLLRQLGRTGEAVIDLEGIAVHQGSAYGSMNRTAQPTQEQFENNLALAIHELFKGQEPKHVWIEDECINIGNCQLPQALWKQIQQSPVIEVQTAHPTRVSSLAKEYGSLDNGFLLESTKRIAKRLGPVQTRLAIEAISEGRMEDFVAAVLVYYDKSYNKALAKRPAVDIVPIDSTAIDQSNPAASLIDAMKYKDKHEFSDSLTQQSS